MTTTIAADVITMTHAPETSATNRLPFSGAGFSYHIRLKWKLMTPKMYVAENDVDDEFAEAAAIIIAGTVAKEKLKRSKS